MTLDSFERTVSTTDPIHGTATFTWTYRADGQPASLSAPNANSTAFGYDDLGRPSAKTTTGTGGVARAAYTWTVNRAGLQLTEDSTISADPTNGTTTYTYDPLARLSGFTRSSTTTAYGWQAVPNRASVGVGANPAVTTTFDDANRPTTDSAGGAYSSDLDGRLTVRPGQRLEWDSLGRLTRVRPPQGNSTIAAYSYDALDRLLLADYGGSNRVRFRYVGGTTAVAQTVDDPSGAVIRHVGTDPSGARLLDWTGSGANQRGYGTNGHHDVTWTADGSGAVTATLRYDPWGTLTVSTGASLPDLRFQASWYDPATDLAWVVTRWYAPTLGRFVSEDSLLGEPADPPSRHLYAYGAGEPIVRWDPDGRWWARVSDPYGEGVQALSSVASRYLGLSAAWPSIWNANRNRFASQPTATTPVTAGTCLYIPSEWFQSGSDRTKYHRANQCYGTRSFQPPFSELIAWLTKAQERTGICTYRIALCFTRSQLYGVTQASIGGTSRRPRNPTATQWTAINGRIRPVNEDAQGFISAGDLPHVLIRPDVLVVSDLVTHTYCGRGGCTTWTGYDHPWFCFSNTCTIGRYVFANGNPMFEHVKSHEYIHVLQYEGLGTDFYTAYADFLVGLGTAIMTPASNRMEAPAYLWSGWTAVLGAYELEPWQVWLRPPTAIR